ncbi:choice-of-anchor Q domain-containing protein [Sulfuriflexus mobilis]|uniref:choice-of-anchor Q domain-containing protein n=1 Tax=Sulfuriflexus mobilis TaxID=1811807 RepID=UPI000F836DE0|nr:choice-of-anchor Q domain-containing protein [Sulfuriflexus mobilis]
MRIQIIKVYLLLLCSSLLISCNNPPTEITIGCDVQELITAINTANNTAGNYHIHLAPGCTYSFTSKDNSNGGHGANALPLITSTIFIEGHQARLERSQSASQQFRLFFISTNGNLRLDDLSIANFYSIGIPDEIDRGGGAIYNDGDLLTVNAVIFEGNHNVANGGAIFNKGTLIIRNNSVFNGNNANIGGALYNTNITNIATYIEDSRFENNIAQTGGAIYNTGGDSDLSINTSEFTDNVAFDDGGAIYTSHGEVLIYSSTFSDNRAIHAANPGSRGGAIFCGDCTLSLQQSTFKLNRADGEGGAIYNHDGDLRSIQKTTFDNNLSDRDGAGLYNLSGTFTMKEVSFVFNNADPFQASGGAIYNGGTGTIEKAYLAANVAEHGGAIYNNGSMSVLNSTFSVNSAREDGGHIYNGQQFDISFSTLAESQAYHGRAIFNAGSSLRIKSSILYNTTVHQNCTDQSGTLQALGVNLDNVGDCPGFSIVADPTLDAVKNNGGYAPTYGLLSGSPAIGATNDCTDHNGITVNQDQRNVARPQPPSTGWCDLGAYEGEVIPAAPPAPPLSKNTSNQSIEHENL